MGGVGYRARQCVTLAQVPLLSVGALSTQPECHLLCRRINPTEGSWDSGHDNMVLSQRLVLV